MNTKNKLKTTCGIIIATIILSSCSIFNKLSAPKYDDNAYRSAVTIDSTVSSLYDGFYKGINLDYSSSVSTYDYAEGVLAAKIASDALRKYPTQILKIDSTYLQILTNAREDHEKDGVISYNHISVNGAFLNQIGNILVNTEKSYK